MKNDTTTTPDAIIHTLTLDRAETQAIAQKYLETLPEGDRPFAAALAQSVSALFGMMQLPIETPGFVVALRILADTFETLAPEIVKQKALMTAQAKATALERFDSAVKH